MGFLDRGRRSKDAVADARSALDRAGEAPADDGVLGAQAVRVVDAILDLGIDGKGWFDPAAQVADEALEATGGDVEAAVDRIVRAHTLKAGSEGFVTGLGGFVTLPVALPANLIAFYALATRMTASVARVRGHDISTPQIRAAVLLTLVGSDADDLIRKAQLAAPAGGRLINLAVQRLPGPVEMVIKKGVFFRLVATAGKGALTRFGRAVPLLGGVLGAGVDVLMLRKIAENARKEFPRSAGAIGSA